jgi:hypothetical protein
VTEDWHQRDEDVHRGGDYNPPDIGTEDDVIEIVEIYEKAGKKEEE